MGDNPCKRKYECTALYLSVALLCFGQRNGFAIQLVDNRTHLYCGVVLYLADFRFRLVFEFENAEFQLVKRGISHKAKYAGRYQYVRRVGILHPDRYLRFLPFKNGQCLGSTLCIHSLVLYYVDRTSYVAEKKRDKNTRIAVNDIKKAEKYYHDIFGLEMLVDNDGNMIEVGTPIVIGKRSE